MSTSEKGELMAEWNGQNFETFWAATDAEWDRAVEARRKFLDTATEAQKADVIADGFNRLIGQMKEAATNINARAGR